LKTVVRQEQKNSTMSERLIRSLEHTCSTFFEKIMALDMRVSVLSDIVKESGLKGQVVDLTAESEDGEGDIEYPESPITLGAGLPMGLVTLSEADFAATNQAVSEMVKGWEVVDTTD